MIGTVKKQHLLKLGTIILLAAWQTGGFALIENSTKKSEEFKAMEDFLRKLLGALLSNRVF